MTALLWILAVLLGLLLLMLAVCLLLLCVRTGIEAVGVNGEVSVEIRYGPARYLQSGRRRSERKRRRRLPRRRQNAEKRREKIQIPVFFSA